MIWSTLLLFVVSFIVTALLAPKPEVENARPQQLKDVSFPRATEDAPIPLILGKVRMDAPNTIWYGDFRAVPIKEKIKTGLFSSTKVIVGHRYFLGIDLALGMGPCTLHTIYMDDKVLWSGTAPDNAVTSFSSSQPSLFGGYKKGGGWVSTNRYYPGTFSQPVDGYVASKVGANQTPAYLGTSHLVMEAEIGESAQLRRVAFVLSSYTNALGLPNSGRVGDDMNVAEAIYQVMTDTWRGMGISSADIDVPSLTALGNVMYAEGNGASVMVTSEAEGGKVVNELLRQADAIAYQDPSTGKIRFRLVRADYNVDDLPVYDEGDVISVKSFTRTSWDEVYAQVKVSFQQRDKESTAIAVQQDMAVVNQLGGRLRTTTLSFPFVYERVLATAIAGRELSQFSVPLFRISLEMNRNAYALRPGDVFKLEWPDYGITQLVLRVNKFDLGALLEGKIVVDCIEDRFAVGTTTFAAPDETSWVDVPVLPTNVAVSQVVEMPRFFARSLTDPIPDGVVGYVSFAQRPGALSTSYTVLAGEAAGAPDATGPSDAEYTGTGTLNVAYDRLSGYTDGYDTTVGMDLANVVGAFDASATTSQQRLAQAGLVLVNSEWMAYGTATVVGPLLQLRNVRRGLLGSQIQTHAASSRVWLFDASKLSDGALDQLLEGDTLYYRMLDSVGARTQDPSEATELSVVVNGQVADRPLRPARPTVSDSRAALVDDSVLRPLAALLRNREVTQIAFEDDATQTPDQAETYDVETYVDGTLNATLSATGVALPYNLRFDLTSINSTNVETRVKSRRTVGNLRSSAAYGFVRYTMAQTYIVGNADYWNTYPGLDGGQLVSVYSLKKRISTYSGPAVRIRDTNDNSEQDVGFDGNGDLAAFTVVGQARVRTVYDQGPAGLNLTQATTTRQPLLLPTGSPNGLRAAIKFAIANNERLDGPTFSDASPNAHLITRPSWFGSFHNGLSSGFTYMVHVPWQASSAVNPFYRIGVLSEPDEGLETRWMGTLYSGAGAVASNVVKTLFVLDSKTDTTKVALYVNGVTTPAFDITNSAVQTTSGLTTGLMIGSNAGFIEGWDGSFMEMCIVNGNTSPAMRAALYTEMNDTWYQVQTTFTPLNPGGESGTTSWTVTGAFTTRAASPAPFAGAAYFYGGDANANSSAYQDLATPGAAATHIDAGRAFVTINWRQAAFDSGGDQGNIDLQFFNASMVSVGTNAGPGLLTVTPGGTWVARTTGRVAVPANTRFVRVKMTSNRTGGSNNDGYFDAINGVFEYYVG
jgi:hypothetical protein